MRITGKSWFKEGLDILADQGTIQERVDIARLDYSRKLWAELLEMMR